MLSYEGLVRLNHLLSGFYRLLWLNLLWVATTVVGLGIFGVGPATYAFAKYVDRWFRLGELPPAAATFRRYATELRWRPVLVSWVLLAVAVVIGVNLLSAANWYLRVANLLALVVLAVIAAYVYFVLAALDVTTIRSTLSAALLLGVGSLHWTIIGTTAVAALYWVMYRFALPLLPVVGIALPMTVVGLIVRGVFRQLAEVDAEEASAANGSTGGGTAGPVGTANPARTEISARAERNDAHADLAHPDRPGIAERHLQKGSAV
ncbi:YesL family protein [Ruania zhangjianzhongii]|uniref:YesL family protein n=1 Tax=Ruania zhangjianzhongii TaxID=2603206 RepID=UPI0011C91330|nr:DUF624 domain-containing protein [Ruania zhangjianzhongii]